MFCPANISTSAAGCWEAVEFFFGRELIGSARNAGFRLSDTLVGLESDMIKKVEKFRAENLKVFRRHRHKA
jgi:hypothetical protein